MTQRARRSGVAIAALGIWLVACRPGSSGSPVAGGVLRGYNVLLVTIDTLRADRVGAYGNRLGLTPTVDRLAAQGLRFTTAYAHVPMTLPSHATLLTGQYPFTNGVRDNGAFALAKNTPTLANALRAAGYRTAAFVGSFVLDARFGLAAGFDLYDDRVRGNSANLEVVQRSADEVLSPASDWIMKGPAPYFAWVHLYDPHEPYDPPEPYRSRYASDLYAGEVAYADAALGTALDRLQRAGMLDRTLIIVASDHGESLGEHGERTHGLFAYDSTLRVPLVFWAAPAVEAAAVDFPARLVDVAPTVLDLIGAPPLATSDGRSLRPFLGHARLFDRAPSYFEALNASLTRHWAPLKGLVLDQLKVIDLPIPELYDVASDPGETRNLYPSSRERARPLEALLDAMGGGATPAPATVDADAEARLRSLGYVVGGTAKNGRTYGAEDDPKRLVHLNAALDAAAALWAGGDAAQAIAMLKQVIRERPDLATAYDRLAFMLQRTGHVADAVAVLEGAARSGYADRALMRSLGAALGEGGDLQRSAAVLEALVVEDGTDLEALDALGQAYARMGRVTDAERLFKRVLATSPNAAATWVNLGVLYLAGDRRSPAIDALTRALAINPSLAGAHNGLGVAYAKQGDVTRAVGEWREALRLRPDLADARANLERVGAR